MSDAIITPIESFWRGKTCLQRFEEKYIPEPTSGCWLWDGQRTTRGYGHFWFDGKDRKAHRISWHLHVGPIPNGMHVLHKCDNPPCVNPDHLFLGTNADNNADMMRKGRNRQPRGADKPHTKLSEEDVVAIYSLRHSLLKPQEVAAVYGVGRTQINKIWKGTVWRWLTEAHDD